MNFSAVILAGGRSQRMGSDKAWLNIEGKPLFARQIELAQQLGAQEVFLSGRAETNYARLNCPVLKDRFENVGPLAGVERALATITSPLLLVLAVDMPRMTLQPLRELLEHCTDSGGAVPRLGEQIEPLAAVYPKRALGLLTVLLENGRYSATHFAERCIEESLATRVDFPEQYSSFFENWNTPADVSAPG